MWEIALRRRNFTSDFGKLICTFVQNMEGNQKKKFVNSYEENDFHAKSEIFNLYIYRNFPKSCTQNLKTDNNETVIRNATKQKYLNFYERKNFKQLRKMQEKDYPGSSQ